MDVAEIEKGTETFDETRPPQNIDGLASRLTLERQQFWGLQGEQAARVLTVKIEAISRAICSIQMEL